MVAPVATATFNLPNPDDMLTALTSRWDFNLAFDLSDLELHASTDVAFRLLGVPHIHDVPMFDATAMHIFTDGSFYAQNDSEDITECSAWALVVIFEDVYGNFAFGGYAADCVHLGFSPNVFSD